MARAKQPVSINGLEFDALIDETRGFEATAPQYTVESGFPVSDAIIIGQESLSMTLYVTNTPVTWYDRHGASMERVESVCKQLEQIFYSSQPVTVITSDAVYSSMAIESMEISKTFDVGYAREIPLTLKKIRVTTSTTTTIPDGYGKGGETEAQVGNANTDTGTTGDTSPQGTGGSPTSGGSGNTDNGSSGDDSTLLYSAAQGFGLI